MKSKYLNLNTLLSVLSCFAMLTFFAACGDDDDDNGEPLSDAKEILSFVFADLTPAVQGNINGTAITAMVPFGTDVTALEPTVTISQEATVSPASGQAQDFSSPVTYTVTAEDGSEATYTVTVNVTAGSPEKELTTFIFESLDPDVAGVITGNDVAVDVPFGTDVSALAPTITLSDLASVAPASGVEQDFSSPVDYTVTAQDGSTNVYQVTVTILPKPGIAITPVWERTLRSGGIPDWFISSVNNNRDVALSTNYVYVHDNNDRIRVLSRTDGTDVSAGFEGDDTNPDKEYINGKENFASGNLFLLNVATDDNGLIFGSNLRVGSADEFPWYVYKWNDKDATQELFLSYPTPAGFRLGENLSIVGDATNDAYIYVPGSGFLTANNSILKFAVSGGVVNTTPDVITLSGLTNLGNAPDVWPVSAASDANFIVAGTEVGGIAEYDVNGNLVGKLPETLNEGENARLFTFALDVAYFELGAQQFVAATSTDFTVDSPTADNGYLAIIDITDGWESVDPADIVYYIFTADGNTETNTNGTGGVDVQVANGVATVAAMITNYGVALVDVTLD
ncbi:MAG: DUF5018 domain-containing protein [Cytophagales bacterium]|nr:DUF5018 domain-containing protein [Cytophagales bacterium]